MEVDSRIFNPTFYYFTHINGVNSTFSLFIKENFFNALTHSYLEVIFYFGFFNIKMCVNFLGNVN